MKNNLHIALLVGGLSSEREVSLNSGRAIAKALDALGYKYTVIDVDRNISAILEDLKPDLAFIALHGAYGEDGVIQGVLEMLRIPYTHSGVTASALAMDKQKTKDILSFHGINMPKNIDKDKLIYPCVIKPVADGSSVGIILAESEDDMVEFEESLYLVEEMIQGRELTVGVLGDKSLEVLEIKPKSGFYDYDNKYTAGNTEYIIPAQIPDHIRQQAMDDALKAHKALGCKSVSRSDFIYDEVTDKLYMLELNTHPGFTQTSLVPKMAAHAGISFNELVDFLIKDAT